MGLNSGSFADESESNEPPRDPFDFCSMEEIDNNKRFQLLQLRSQDVSQFKNLTMIPCDEQDLDEEMLQVFHFILTLHFIVLFSTMQVVGVTAFVYHAVSSVRVMQLIKKFFIIL